MRGAKTIGAVLVALGALVLARPAHAGAGTEPYLMSVGVLGGVGGAFDVNGADPGLSNPALELQLGLVTEPSTLLELRVGRLDFGSSDQLGTLSSAQLDYATIAGEYRFDYTYYESGMFLGIGAYRLSGDRAGGHTSNTAFGGTFGVTGNFELNRWLSIVGELSAHYAELEEAKLFGDAKVGLAVRF